MGEEVIIRNAKKRDIPQIIEVEKAAWGEGGAATEQIFRSRFDVFPEGIFVAEKGGVIVGDGVLEIIEGDLGKGDVFTWYQITDNGFLKKSHKDNGKYLYGVNLSVNPQAQNSGIGLKLIENGLKVAIDRKLQKFFFGARIPGFCNFAKKMSVGEYVFAKDDSGHDIILDPELRFYLRPYLGSMPRIVKILPNYFNDPESLNYGVLVEWNNPYC